MLQFGDRLSDVIQGAVRRRLLRWRVEDLGVPSPRQLLQGRDVDVAVVEELFERRHVLLEESSVGADRVAAQRDRPWFGDVFFEERQSLRFGLLDSSRWKLVDGLDEAGFGVHLGDEVAHLGHLFRVWRE